jgi:hypothetical protein
MEGAHGVQWQPYYLTKWSVSNMSSLLAALCGIFGVCSRDGIPEESLLDDSFRFSIPLLVPDAASAGRLEGTPQGSRKNVRIQ